MTGPRFRGDTVAEAVGTLIGYGIVIGSLVLLLVGCATWRPVPGYTEAETACAAQARTRPSVGARTSDTLALVVPVLPLVLPLGGQVVAERQQRTEECMSRRGFPPGSVVRERVSTQ